MPNKSLSRSSLLSYQKYSSLLAGNDPFLPSSFELLETQVLASSAASVTFSGLDAYAADYKHLQIRYVARDTQAQLYAGITMRFNSDSGSNYSWHALKGDGSSVSSWGVANTTGVQTYQWETAGANQPANVFGAGVYDILDPFESTKYTTTRLFGGRGASPSDPQIPLTSGSWRNTAALTTIQLNASANFVAASRFSIYGIRG